LRVDDVRTKPHFLPKQDKRDPKLN
jgi:hypothetical protein